MAYSPLTTYLPLNQAAQKYGLAEQDLLDQIEAGHIVPARLPTGELLVAETDVDASLKIKLADYDHLRGEAISMRQASQVYEVPYSTIRGWVLAGVIEPLNQSETGQGKATLLDRAQVAYCVAVYKAKWDLYQGQLVGVSIFDKAGAPYRVKYPDVASARRRERQRKRDQRS